MAAPLLSLLALSAPAPSEFAAPDAAQGWSELSLRAAASRASASTHKQNAGAASLLFVNDSNIAGVAHHSELISLDLATQKMTKVSTTMTSFMDYLSASVVCGGKYYAVATNAPIATGIVVVDMATGNATLHPTERSLMHALACGSAPGKVLVVESQFTTPPTFSLREYDVASESSTAIYTFPKSTLWGGWDSTFSFARPGELWATFPLGKDILHQKRGELYIVDTNGTLKEHKKVGLFDAPGEPYLVIPSDGDTFEWLLAPNGEATAAEDLVACQADKSGHELKVSGCKKAASLWAIGAVPAICGGTAYIGSLTGDRQTTNLFSVSTTTGEAKPITTIDLLAPGYHFGALTCGA